MVKRMYRPTIERIGVAIHRNEIRCSRTPMPLDAPASGTKPIVSDAALARWPVLAMKIIVLPSALSPPLGAQAQPPAPPANAQWQALIEETLPAGSVGRG